MPMALRSALLLAIVLSIPHIARCQNVRTWAPPDVDAEKLDLDSSTTCDLPTVMERVSDRVEKLVQNVDRYTATEKMQHFELSPTGSTKSRETRRFAYLVEIRRAATGELDVHEYRSGWMPTEKIRGYPIRTEFPENIETVGLAMLALIFHPDFQPRYDFACEGLGSWHARPAWLVHFRQRPDQSNSMLTYRVGNRSAPVALKGRAWIDEQTSQIVAIESDIVAPIPEIQLTRDHQLVEYGPVHFKSKSLDLWLPTSADWYCQLNAHHYHRRHLFSNFLLFSVDDTEKISPPATPAAPRQP
jgi:hypothetical protein